jgi:hypothetical protein
VARNEIDEADAARVCLDAMHTQGPPSLKRSRAQTHGAVCVFCDSRALDGSDRNVVDRLHQPGRTRKDGVAYSASPSI